MSFKIVITEERTVKKLVGKDWTVIGSKEVEREPKFYGGVPSEPKSRIEDVRGYTPEIEKFVTETVEVLTQVVGTLDLAKVIKAINGL